MAERRASVLIVDDDPSLSAFLVRLLTQAGFEARAAATEAQAVERLAERPADLLVVDLVLGRENGWRAAARLASGKPFVMMTGAGPDPEATRDAQMLGAAALVHKPFESEAFLALLRRLLGPSSA